MARHLTATTIVRHPETGDLEVLTTDTPLPAWAEGLVGDHILTPLEDAPPTQIEDAPPTQRRPRK